MSTRHFYPFLHFPAIHFRLVPFELNRKHKLIVHQLIWIHFNLFVLLHCSCNLATTWRRRMMKKNRLRKSRKSHFCECNKIHSFPRSLHSLCRLYVTKDERKALFFSRQLFYSSKAKSSWVFWIFSFHHLFAFWQHSHKEFKYSGVSETVRRQKIYSIRSINEAKYGKYSNAGSWEHIKNLST